MMKNGQAVELMCDCSNPACGCKATTSTSTSTTSAAGKCDKTVLLARLITMPENQHSHTSLSSLPTLEPIVALRSAPRL